MIKKQYTIQDVEKLCNQDISAWLPDEARALQAELSVVAASANRVAKTGAWIWGTIAVAAVYTPLFLLFFVSVYCGSIYRTTYFLWFVEAVVPYFFLISVMNKFYRDARRLAARIRRCCKRKIQAIDEELAERTRTVCGESSANPFDL